MLNTRDEIDGALRKRELLQSEMDALDAVIPPIGTGSTEYEKREAAWLTSELEKWSHHNIPSENCPFPGIPELVSRFISRHRDMVYWQKRRRECLESFKCADALGVARLAPGKLEEIKLALASNAQDAAPEHVKLLVAEVDRYAALVAAVYDVLDDTLDDESGMHGTDPADAIAEAMALLRNEIAE